jgi:hypothetical protein
MDDNGLKPVSPACGPECACNARKGLSMKSKTIFLTVIIIAAGAVLGNSLIRKSRSAAATPDSGFSAALSMKNSAAAPLSGSQQGQSSETKAAGENVSLTPLASLASLDTVAREVDGVFILLVNSETDKTPAMLKEIFSARSSIVSRGMHVSVFHLLKEAPDYAMITSQMPAPGVLVMAKGRGMRGVSGKDITETKLLQAWIAALQPGGCCPAGGKRVCK